MMMKKFNGNFTQQKPIPEEAISDAVAVMRHGRLHRYNVLEDEVSQVSALEQEFAASMGARYALAVASGGYALRTALRALNVQAGDNVLTNAFTLAPVPGAIAAIGAVPVFVGVTQDLVLDFDDLVEKAPQAKVLLLSHMRGHHCDMDVLMQICAEHEITVIEDCAHTMGAYWRDAPSGRFGVFGCYSTQTYKHINSGEGGFLISDDAELMAKAVLLSGSYMLYERHLAAPPRDVFKKFTMQTPNISGRMDNLRAAILRPQLRELNAQAAAWNARYERMAQGLRKIDGVYLPQRPEAERPVSSSIQFLLLDWGESKISQFLARCAARGVKLKWFGAQHPNGFTSRYQSWGYAADQSLPKTDRILDAIIDMRLPLTFSLQDCDLIAEIISDEVKGVST